MLSKLQERALLYTTGLTDKDSRECKEAHEFAEKSLIPAHLVAEYTKSSDFLVDYGTIKAILRDSVGEPAVGFTVNFTTNLGCLDDKGNKQETSAVTDERGEATVTLRYVVDNGSAILPDQMGSCNVVAFYNNAPDRLFVEMKPFAVG